MFFYNSLWYITLSSPVDVIFKNMRYNSFLQSAVQRLADCPPVSCPDLIAAGGGARKPPLTSAEMRGGEETGGQSHERRTAL